MMTILFTQCLQNDFIRPIPPDSPLPNPLHIGYSEARRLTQTESRLGNLYLFLDQFYTKRTRDHHAIHIRDWHTEDDPMQKQHLQFFGPHCIAGTDGARFVEQLERHHPEQYDDAIIHSLTLNDFVHTSLQQEMEARGIKTNTSWRGAIIGVWTDVKVQYLAYDLMSRYPKAKIAVCSALCASRSLIRHRWALEFMRHNLNLVVMDSISELLEFLGLRPQLGQYFLSYQQSPLIIRSETALSLEQEQVVRYLFRDSSEVTLKPLGGGFSGAKVFAVTSVDRNGKTEVPQVLKIDLNAKIGRERSAVESIENLLGISSPRIKETIHNETLGGIRYFFANMNNTRTVTLQSVLKKLLHQPLSFEEKIKKFKTLFEEIDSQLFSRLYQNPVKDRINLFTYYDYRPEYGKTTLGKIEELLKISLNNCEWISLPAVDGKMIRCINPRRFYENLSYYLTLPPVERLMTWVHGDLNLANLLTDEKNNFWMIDFYHTRIGHLMNDFAKMENDIKFILQPVDDEIALQQAYATEYALICHPGDSDLSKVSETEWLVRWLRGIMQKYLQAELDPVEYAMALLRYSAHSLLFEECNSFQKQAAAFSTCLLADTLYRAFLPETSSLPEEKS